MNYESTEERIERLEKQMAGLLKITQDVIAMLKDNNELYPKLLAILADQDVANAKATLMALKLVVENSTCIGQSMHQAMIASINQAIEKSSIVPSVLEGLNKLKRVDIVLPEDLFGR